MLLKICGIKRQSDLTCASNLGYDLCGFIFHPSSPRYINPQEAAGLKSGRMLRVGVFVNQSVDEIKRSIDIARLDYVQLHGKQTVKDARELDSERIIRTLWPGRSGIREFLNQVEKWENVCRYFLLDAGSGGGGSGQCIEEEKLYNLSLSRPWFLAGGLKPNNIREKIEKFSPSGIDLNSGLEDAPGHKNHGKLKEVIAITGRFV